MVGETLSGILDHVTQADGNMCDSAEKMVERRNEGLIDRPNPDLRIELMISRCYRETRFFDRKHACQTCWHDSRHAKSPAINPFA